MPPFPKTNFLIVVAPKSVDNVWSYIPAMQDISFVSGFLAAKMSKTAAVGVVASFNFSNVTWQAEGFRLGARYANPKIKTYSTYINSFDDVGKAKEAAQAELDSGADVILARPTRLRAGSLRRPKPPARSRSLLIRIKRVLLRRRFSQTRLPTSRFSSEMSSECPSRVRLKRARSMRSAWLAA
jgi:hypothetical protein